MRNFTIPSVFIPYLINGKKLSNSNMDLLEDFFNYYNLDTLYYVWDITGSEYITSKHNVHGSKEVYCVSVNAIPIRYEIMDLALAQ